MYTLSGYIKYVLPVFLYYFHYCHGVIFIVRENQGPLVSYDELSHRV